MKRLIVLFFLLYILGCSSWFGDTKISIYNRSDDNSAIISYIGDYTNESRTLQKNYYVTYDPEGTQDVYLSATFAYYDANDVLHAYYFTKHIYVDEGIFTKDHHYKWYIYNGYTEFEE